MAGSPTPSQIAAAAKGKQLTPEEVQARRDAALEAARQAEAEAATAAQERDAAAARARDALQRAAQARAEAALGDPDAKDPVDDKAASDAAAPDEEFHQAMLSHEAAAVVNLHHHAASVQNIRNMVHVILDIADDNY
jgi:hypothetical protein